jgi:membrane protein required for colicin V production
VDFITSIDRFDLFVGLFLLGMFVLGFFQGTIRRVLGIGSMIFSFLVAANLRGPLGSFLATYWNQFPDEYAIMLGFGIVFVAATIAFTLVIQGFYKHQPLFEKATFVDEVLGGFLGIIQGLFLIGFVMIVLDTYFDHTNFGPTSSELLFLRGFHDFYDSSLTAELLRSQLIPGFMNVFGLLIPGDLRTMFAVFS